MLISQSREVLNNLKTISIYFEKHIQSHEIFRFEFETSQKINKVLEENENLKKTDVIEVLSIFNAIEKVEHYDGSGWINYQICLTHYLWLNGFSTVYENRELRLVD